MPTFNCPVGDKPLIVETGKLAGQAHGAVTIRYGDTVLLATACLSPQLREGVDFLPLTVDFEERLYAAGKIPGGFFRREGRPTQDATLAARLADRSLRPLFPKGFRNDIHIVLTVLSADRENLPEVLGLVGASAALTLSPIPFLGPIGAVRVGYVNGQWVLNPTFSQLQESLLEVVVAGTQQAIVMLEAEAREAPEALLLEAIARGQEANQEIISLQKDMAQVLGQPKMEFQPIGANPQVAQALASLVGERLRQVLERDKGDREDGLSHLQAEALQKLTPLYPQEEVTACFEAQVKAQMRSLLLQRGVRLDGRPFNQLRPISAEVGVLPRPHGTGLFTRGNTQVLTIATLASTGMEQTIDSLSPEESKRFMHHYNFPPFSTGEVRRMGGPGRREIGHGALVERALAPVLPSKEEFPYAIRLVSEVLSSNGSTSMASVCGATLSLMDAGVPIKTPVAGVAMGLLTGQDGGYTLLTDIAGAEDAYGDMDFKVAGTRQGVTAVQMDVKLHGVSLETVEKALSGAREARLQILERMAQALPQPRPQVSTYAPKIYKLTVDPDKIGAIIGTGGKTIRSIEASTKATVEVENDGTVYIGAVKEEQAQNAIKIVQALTQEIKVGQIFTGRVSRLLGIGAMVEVLPNKEGLVPLEELADYRVRRPEDVVKIGDEIMVKVMEIDSRGRLNLSRRAVFEGVSPAPGGREGGGPGHREPGGPGERRGPPSRPFHRRPPPPQGR